MSVQTERAARGALLGQPGRARELLAILDQEQPERKPALRDSWVSSDPWVRRVMRPRQRATKCPHPDRWMHARGLCEGCYTRWRHAQDPELWRERTRLKKAREHEVLRLQTRERLGLSARASEYEVASVAQALAWDAQRRAAASARMTAEWAERRKRRAAGIRAARSRAREIQGLKDEAATGWIEASRLDRVGWREVPRILRSR